MDGGTNQAIEKYVASERGRFGSDGEQCVVLGLYRRLARGAPVSAAALARHLEASEKQVEEVLGALPPSWIERDTAGRITGFCGLGLAATRHRLTAAGVTLFAWCAFDCLFLPEILDRELRVESKCPETGIVVTLAVSREGVVRARPEGTVMSFVTPDIGARRRDLRQVFCRHINFFASTEAFAAWRRDIAKALILSLDEAHALGRRRNAAVFDAVLGG